jgi:protein-disulfide isomerase
VTGGLILAQALMGHFCKYCMVVDVSTLIVGGLAIDRYRAGWDPPGGRLLQALVPWAFVAAFATPFALARSQPSPIPPLIVAEVGKTPRGEVTLVDFVDFECPFCRQLHERLSPMLASKPGKFRVVRKLVPLTRIHPHALAAAKAACCAEALGKGDAMADVLFRTSVDDLTPDGCANLAASLGLPLDAYKACIDSPETTARLVKDRQDFDKTAVKGDGLPLMWIGPRKVMGAADEATLSKVVGEALASARD